jgi:hypothetical protein
VCGLCSKLMENPHAFPCGHCFCKGWSLCFLCVFFPSYSMLSFPRMPGPTELLRVSC